MKFIILCLGILYFGLSSAQSENIERGTQNLECTSESFYDSDSKQWHLSLDDRRSCEVSKSSSSFSVADLDCPDGTSIARVRQSNGYGYGYYGYNHYGQSPYDYNPSFTIEIIELDDLTSHKPAISEYDRFVCVAEPVDNI